jgi:hypothetical protein
MTAMPCQAREGGNEARQVRLVKGGPTMPGRVYIVGERGPELWIGPRR